MLDTRFWSKIPTLAGILVEFLEPNALRLGPAIQDTGYRVQDAGYTGCRMLGILIEFFAPNACNTAYWSKIPATGGVT